MLDFYAVDDIGPWPKDVPSASRLIGAMDLREFDLCAPVVQACLRRLGIEGGSYFEDWIVPRDAVGALIKSLGEASAAPDMPGNVRAAVAALISIIAHAEGSILLAVCD